MYSDYTLHVQQYFETKKDFIKNHVQNTTTIEKFKVQCTDLCKNAQCTGYNV